MTFCPEVGDPAQIKPKIYTDPDLFGARTGQGVLVAAGAVAESRDIDAASVEIIDQLLRSPTGLPLYRSAGQETS